jgi:hypothetical protein
LPEDFKRALHRVASQYRQQIDVNYPSVAALLWPKEAAAPESMIEKSLSSADSVG